MNIKWDDDWIYGYIGTQQIPLADIERLDSGEAIAHVHHWRDVGRGDHGTGVGIHCRSTAEAVAVIQALLGVRGVQVLP